MVCGHQIYPQNIPTRGIRAITAADVASAEKLGCVIKLIAWMKLGKDGSVAAGVEPCLVPKANQLASVDDVFNAVLVKGDMLGDVVFYGKGAGKLPTASAVVADVVDALKNGAQVHIFFCSMVTHSDTLHASQHASLLIIFLLYSKYLILQFLYTTLYLK